MILMGIDPSYTRAGIAILNTETKEVILDKLEGKMNKNYENNWSESIDRCKKLSNIISQYHIDYAISEHPFPGAESSCGLYLLDGMLHYTLYLSKISKTYVTHPSHLKHLHGGKYHKSDSINLYNELKVVFMKHGYSFNKNRICNDEAEAFIFLTRLFVLLNVDNKLINDIIKINKRFIDKKEKVLYERGIK